MVVFAAVSPNCCLIIVIQFTSSAVRVIRFKHGGAVAGAAEGAAGRADDGAADGHGRHEPAEHEPGTDGRRIDG